MLGQYPDAATGNTIAFNGYDGIKMDGAGLNNTYDPNSIYGNGSLGSIWTVAELPCQ